MTLPAVVRILYPLFWVVAVSPGLFYASRGLIRALRARARLRDRDDRRLLPDAQDFVRRQRAFVIGTAINVLVGIGALLNLVIDGPFSIVYSLLVAPILIAGQGVLSYMSYVEDRQRERRIPLNGEKP